MYDMFGIIDWLLSKAFIRDFQVIYLIVKSKM